jgi:SEC-C motif-containing protein
MSECPCGSGQAYAECCEPLITGAMLPPDAERLMRSRYSAYQQGIVSYLGESLHPDYRSDWDEAATQRWADSADWLGLEILAIEDGGEDDERGTVEFIANYRENGMVKRYHEVGEFVRHDDRWYYVQGYMPTPVTHRNEAPKVGRNDPCPCGSGKKYKKCCGQ